MSELYFKSLYLRNFRNFEESDIQLDPGINWIHGKNAQGKTNLLEAVHLISTGRSFRTSHLKELIRHGASFFYLEAEIVNQGVSQKIKLSFDGEEKRLHVDGSLYKTFQPLLGNMPFILYASTDTDLIMGGPLIRRKFLNFHLGQSDPLYVHHLTRYVRAMKQRNCLLRADSDSSIQYWEEEMARSALYLYQARHSFLEELKKPLRVFSQIFTEDQESYEVSFLPSFPAEYLQQLQKNRWKEKKIGLTLLGPHRDDLAFLLQEKEMKTFGSEGQKKTVIAALRLSEWEIFFQKLQIPPIMGIDDLCVSLDATRQTLFLEELFKRGQVFITSPAVKNFSKPITSIQIKQGTTLCQASP